MNYVWVALLFMIIASAVSFLIDAARPREKASDPVGRIVGALYARIVIMQIAKAARLGRDGRLRCVGDDGQFWGDVGAVRARRSAMN